MKQNILCGFAAASTLLAVGAANAAEIVFVDSYHEGYEWSDGITRGIQETLEGKGHNLTIVRMDTKRNKGDDFKTDAAAKALQVIKEKNADVVIACDDNAAKFLIVPHLKDTDTQVVFCGVNWDASGYGFPAPNVTGMVEVASVDELVAMLSPAAAGDRVGYIGPDTATERKNAKFTGEKFGEVLNITEEVFVKTFDEFKEQFAALQSKVDILVFPNYAGIEGWDEAAAAEFALANTKIPTGSMHDFMAPYVTLVFGKVADEQGRWSANSALEILGGKKAGDIEMVHNSEGYMVINAKMATEAGIDLPAELVEVANEILE